MKVLRVILTLLASGLLLLVLPFAALSFQLDRTLLNVAYLQAELTRADPVTLGLALGRANLTPDQPEIAAAMLDAVADARPAIEAQLSTAIDAVHGYLTSRRDKPDFPLNVEPLRAALRQRLTAALQKRFSAELKDTTPAEIDQHVGETVGRIMDQLPKVPDLVTLDLLPREHAASVASLRQALQLVHYAMFGLYAAAVLLLAAVWWLGSLRLAGGLLAAGGGLVYGGHAVLVSAAQAFIPGKLDGWPDSVRALVPGVIDRVLEPIATFGVGCLGLGLVLFIASFFLSRRAPAPAPVPLPDNAGQPPAPPPPPRAPNWLQRNPGKSAGLAVVVVVLLALWPGDVIARYQAAKARDRGRAAQAAGDWTVALATFRDSTRYRPGDRALRHEYETAQGQWLHTVDAKIASLTAEERWNFFRDPAQVAIRAGLSEPLAAGHEMFIRQNRELVCDHIEAAFTAASALLEAGKWTEAQARVDAEKPFAPAHEGFSGLLEDFADEMAGQKLDHAVAQAEHGEIAPAREVLAGLKDNPYLSADELADAAYRVNFADYTQQVATAVEVGRGGEFARGLAQLAALEVRAKELQADPAHARAFPQLTAAERAALVSNPLAAGRRLIRQNATQAQGRKIVQAVRTGHAEEVQSALDDLARLAGHSFAASGTLLLEETDFARYQAFLQDLALAGEPESLANRLDVALVAAVQGHFTDQVAVRHFLAEGFTAWAERFGRQGHTALALYLSDLATQEGAAEDPKDRAQAFKALREQFTCSVCVAPTTVPEGSVSSATTVIHTAICNTLAQAGGGWLKVLDGVGEDLTSGLIVQSVVDFPPEEHSRNESNWSVHYQSGTRTEDNPDYANLEQALQQARRTHEDNRQGAAQIASQSQALAASDPYGAVAAAATTAYANAALEESANRVNQLYNQLANTPRTLSFPVYTDENIPVTEHVLNHPASLAVSLLDEGKPAGSSTWSAKLYYTTREWPGSAQANVSAMRANVLDSATAGDRLARDLAAKVAHQPNLLLRPLVQQLARQLAGKTKDAPPLEKAEQAWGLTQLWRAGGVTVDDYAQQETAVQCALDLDTVAPDGTSAAKLPQPGQAYENSLGMRFLPVAHTGVLFSIWETRLQDFTAFVDDTHYDAITGSPAMSIGAGGWAASGSNWIKPGFVQTPTHPVCAINRADAAAFCAWLTLKERAAGRIGAEQEYRLPTDAEWSRAAGLARETNGTPEQKMGRSSGYSWGPDWPPPPGAGNLAGYEVRGGVWPEGWNTLPNLGDGYIGTAPVGQYSANPFGLYDMDGNVEEWCSDAFNAKADKGVVRGSGFSSFEPVALQLSNREQPAPLLRATSYGFRVVLSVGQGAR